MRTLIIYAHPNKNSFNHALFEKSKETLLSLGHEVKSRDLYDLKFNPVLSASDLESIQNGKVPSDITEEQKQVLWANHLLFIYPVWWIGPPAILKGWVDKVFLNGFAFSYKSGGPQGLLKHKRALVVCTAGSPKEELQSMGMTEMIYRPITDGTLKYCGIANSQEIVLNNISGAGQSGREKMLDEVSLFLKKWKD